MLIAAASVLSILSTGLLSKPRIFSCDDHRMSLDQQPTLRSFFFAFRIDLLIDLDLRGLPALLGAAD